MKNVKNGIWNFSYWIVVVISAAARVPKYLFQFKLEAKGLDCCWLHISNVFFWPKTYNSWTFVFYTIANFYFVFGTFQYLTKFLCKSMHCFDRIIIVLKYLNIRKGSKITVKALVTSLKYIRRVLSASVFFWLDTENSPNELKSFEASHFHYTLKNAFLNIWQHQCTVVPPAVMAMKMSTFYFVVTILKIAAKYPNCTTIKGRTCFFTPTFIFRP